MIDPDEVRADPSVCRCGLPVIDHGPIGRTGVMRWRCEELPQRRAQLDAWLEFGQRPWWQRWTRRKPTGWRSA